MSERLMTYDEASEALGRSPEAVRQMCKRRRWRRTIGNDGRARISVPLEALEILRPPDDPRPSDRTTPERPPVVPPDAASEPTGDARALLDMLQARIAELDGEVRELRPKATRADVLEAMLEAERQRVEDLKAERDRWHTAATATPPSLFEKLRRAFG